MAFNEDSRLKIPTILHLARLGYDYLSLAGTIRDTDTNNFTDIFLADLHRLNPGLTEVEAWETLEQLTMTLDSEDLGRACYEMLTSRSGPIIIDFEKFSKNQLNVVTELPCINSGMN